MLTSQPSPTQDPDRLLFSANLPREHGFEPLRVDGQLPADLRGTLFRNGPGLFELFGRRYDHPFEADGAITAVRLQDGQAFGAARITASKLLAKEQAAGKALYGFTAPWPQRLIRSMRDGIKNTANTNVVAWQGRLFALMEASPPTEISPDDLHTIGETSLDGAVPGAFSAHPHRVAARNALYNFGVRYGRQSKIDLFELPDAGPARRLGSVPLPFAPMLHDFCATDEHLVFLVSPVKVNVPRALLQVGGFAKMFEYSRELGTEVVVVPIDAPERVIRFRVESFFQWHFSNAFERQGRIEIDFVRYPDFASFEWLGGGVEGPFPTGTLHRATIDPNKKTLAARELWDVGCEFPRVHPDREGRDYRYAWVQIDAPNAIARVDVATAEAAVWTTPAHQRACEPVFVPRAGTDDESAGWVLTLVYDAVEQRSHLAVLDGERLADGPVARAWFDHHVPITFHGNWVPA